MHTMYVGVVGKERWILFFLFLFALCHKLQ